MSSTGGGTRLKGENGDGAGVMEVIGNYVAAVQESAIEFTLSPALTMSPDSYILCVLDGTVTNSTDIEMQVNQDSSANYFADGARIRAGVETLIDNNTTTEHTVATSLIVTGALPFFAIIEIGLTQGAVGGTDDSPRFFSRAQSDGYENLAGRLDIESASITHVKFISSTFPWRVGTRITLYKVSRT